MIETLEQKIIRHIKEGSFDPATLRRGISQIRGYLLSINERCGILLDPQVENNYLGLPDLTVARYSYHLPRPRRLYNNFVRFDPIIHVVDFPVQSAFNLSVFPRNSGGLDTESFFHALVGRGGIFTGPTYLYKTDGGPNNGFYTREEGLLTEFQDTNPSGQRRGAFGITDEGEIIVMDDNRKWDIVRSGFPGLRALMGTSHFLTSNDCSKEDSGYSGKERLSYLMQYRVGNGKRVCFVLSTNGYISTPTIKKVLDDYCQKMKGMEYIAVEMENSTPQCLLRGEGEVKFGGIGFGRRDHYFVRWPKTA